jgi:hypothetical protein
MLSYTKRISLLAALGLAALGGAVSPVGAQSTSTFRVVPGLGSQSPTDLGIGRSTTYPYDSGFRTAPMALPYYGWNPYYPNWDPYGGGLQGAAAAISAQGEFQIQWQQSRLLGQEVERSKIDTRRKQYDEWLYERATRPTIEDERERMRLEQVRRARNDPPLAEIWSGKSLNDLLAVIQRMQAQNQPGPTVPLDPDTLQHTNLTTGVSPEGMGLLKDGGKLHWPLALSDSPYEADRKQMEQLMDAAIKQVQGSGVDGATLRAMKKTIANMRETVKNNLDDLTPSEEIQAKRYMNELDSTVRALQDPDVSKYLASRYAARGATVADLVQQMNRQGLKFAPAMSGDEAAYVALHRALVDYYQWPNPGRPWDPYTK